VRIAVLILFEERESVGREMDRLKRLKRELLSIQQESDDVKKQMRIEVEDEDMSQVTAFLSGPPDSPYAGGTFKIQILLPKTYPFDPPAVNFVTKVWHPNISLSDGYVCLDTLSTKWSPALTLQTLLWTLQALLNEPCARDPLNLEVALQMRSSHPLYEKTAVFWTKEYACETSSDGPESEEERLVKEVIRKQIRRDRDSAIHYLSTRGWVLGKGDEDFMFGAIRRSATGRGRGRGRSGPYSRRG
jgi:ubiquitin-conjugating enzyme (huntingtin interacting protein 2)